jgi:hypothetical protein
MGWVKKRNPAGKMTPTPIVPTKNQRKPDLISKSLLSSSKNKIRNCHHPHAHICKRRRRISTPPKALGHPQFFRFKTQSRFDDHPDFSQHKGIRHPVKTAARFRPPALAVRWIR